MSDFHESFNDGNAPLKPTNFSFGITFFLLFLSFSLFLLFKQHENLFFISLFISALFLTLTLTKRDWLDPFNSAWSKFSQAIGKITQPIIMFFLFFGIVTPLAILLRPIFLKEIFKIK